MTKLQLTAAALLAFTTIAASAGDAVVGANRTQETRIAAPVQAAPVNPPKTLPKTGIIEKRDVSAKGTIQALRD